MSALKSLLPLLTMTLLVGCGTTPVSHYYMLTPTEQPASTPRISDEALIGIGPVRFPKYLDRPQIVTRTANAEIYLAETERWAEPLQENFTRVLAENLSRALGTERISIEPSRNRTDVDYRISADILQFDAGENDEVILLAYWSIQNKNSASLTGMQKTEIRLPLSRSTGRVEFVSQLSSTITELGREIAAHLARLSAKPAQEIAP